MANDVLGYTKCETGGRATVHKMGRGKARYLYTRCDCCGCDQRTGATVQTRLYTQTEWIGEAPEPPPNLLTTEIQPKTQVVEPEIQPKKEPEPQPKTTEWEPEPQPKQQPTEQPKGSGLGLLAIAGAALSIVGVCLARVAK